MLDNTLEKFTDDVFKFLTGKTRVSKSLIIKKHTENLQVLGDFSFPNKLKPWHRFLESELTCDNLNSTLLHYIGIESNSLIQESKKWVLNVKIVTEAQDRIHFFLERPSTIRIGFLEALKNNESILMKLQGKPSSVQIDPLCKEETDLTSLRLEYLSKTIQNLYALCAELQECGPNVFITSKSSSESPESRMILCGTVLNARTGAKETKCNADEFVKVRQSEMTLIAQHKYGVRVSTDAKWREFIAHLGESAVIFELLQTKPSSAVKINFDCSAGSSKGAAFILYNCARLETIMRTYNDKVADGTYPPLPGLDDTDLKLLTQEDEWNLVFNFILGFPSVLANCMEVNDKVCEFRPHHICSFLCSMVRVFSQYYRRVRILTEARRHLLPVMFARIHMLKILNDTLKTCLTILNIKSVTQM